MTTSHLLRSSLSSILGVALAACATASDQQQGLGSGDGGTGDTIDASPRVPFADASQLPGQPDAADLPGLPDAGSPDATPVVEDPDAAPAGCTNTVVNLLSNPNLDQGQGGGWVETSSGGYDLIVTDDQPGVTANTGIYVAWLSGYDDALDSLYQDVTVPADATAVSLRGVRWIATEEDPSAVAFDVAILDISTTGGTQLEQVKQWSNMDSNSGWAAYNLPVTGNYQGQTVRMRLRSDTDDSFPTHFLFDSLKFQVTTCL